MNQDREDYNDRGQTSFGRWIDELGVPAAAVAVVGGGVILLVGLASLLLGPPFP